MTIENFIELLECNCNCGIEISDYGGIIYEDCGIDKDCILSTLEKLNLMDNEIVSLEIIDNLIYILIG